jgi:N-methylhydantoinase A
MFRTAQGLRSVDTPRYERDRLPVEEPISGPAIILQADSTTVVPPDARVSALWDGNLVIRLKEG